MTYSVVAIGWVPNISQRVTSDEHIAKNIRKPRNGITFEFDSIPA